MAHMRVHMNGGPYDKRSSQNGELILGSPQIECSTMLQSLALYGLPNPRHPRSLKLLQ